MYFETSKLPPETNCNGVIALKEGSVPGVVTVWDAVNGNLILSKLNIKESAHEAGRSETAWENKR